MNTIRITAATVSIGAAVALGVVAPATARTVTDAGAASSGTVADASAQPGPGSVDYEAYIAFRKAQLSLQRAARP